MQKQIDALPFWCISPIVINIISKEISHSSEKSLLQVLCTRVLVTHQKLSYNSNTFPNKDL